MEQVATSKQVKVDTVINYLLDVYMNGWPLEFDRLPRLPAAEGFEARPPKSFGGSTSGGSNAAPSRVRTGVSDGGSTSADPRRSGRPPSRAAAASSEESRRSSSAVGASARAGSIFTLPTLFLPSSSSTDRNVSK